MLPGDGEARQGERIEFPFSLFAKHDSDSELSQDTAPSASHQHTRFISSSIFRYHYVATATKAPTEVIERDRTLHAELVCVS